MYDFDQVIDRSNTDAVKIEQCRQLFGSADVTPLWIADMDFAVPQPIVRVVEERLSRGILGNTERTQAFGRCVSRWQQQRHGWAVDPADVEYSPGVMPSIVIALRHVTAPGDGVIIQPPVYPPFFDAVSHNGRRLVLNHLVRDDEGRFRMDLDEFERLASQPDVKAFVLCHPHNPVGREWTPAELTALGDICVRHGVRVISDEIHSDIMLGRRRHVPFASLRPEFADISYTMMAASKTFNITGLSTSYVIASNPELMEGYRSRLAAAHLSNSTVFGPIATQAAYTHCAPWLDELLDYLTDNVDTVCRFIADRMPEVLVSKPEATFLLWLDFSQLGLSRTDLHNAIFGKARVGLNDGLMFGDRYGQCLRLNVATPQSVLMDAMERIAQVCSMLRPK